VSCEVLVRTRLLADPEVVTALSGGSIYPLLRPQTEPLPAITYQRISATRFDPLEAPMPLADARLQLDCWAKSYAEVKDLARAVRQSLNGFAGPPGPRPCLRAIRAFPDDRDLFESESGTYRVSQDFSVWWEED
jgi:hypothetical protein